MDDSVDFWWERARSADIREIAERVCGAKLRKAGGEFVGACPSHGGNDGFSVNRRKRVFNCRRAGEGGDVIAMVEHAQGCSASEAAELINGEPRPGRARDETAAEKQARLDRNVRLAAEAEARADKQRKAEEAEARRKARTVEALHKRGGPVVETPYAMEYFKARGLTPHPRLLKGLRYDPAVDYYQDGSDNGAKAPVWLAATPAIIADIRDAGGEVIGQHLTHLDPNKPGKWKPIGDPGNRPRKVQGLVKGGLIRFGRPNATLAVGEGIESVLSWHQLGHGPEDVALAAGVFLNNLKAVRLPEGVVAISIIADNDSDPITLHREYRAAIEWFVQCRIPLGNISLDWPPPGSDWNDVLLHETRGDPLREDLKATEETQKFRHQGGVETAEEFVERARSLLDPPPPPPPPPPSDPPEIMIRAGEIERVVNETEAALIAEQEAMPVSKRLFRRGGMVASIGFNTEPTHDGGTVEAQVIVEVGDYALGERIASAAVFKKYNERKKKVVRVDPPHNVAVTLKQRRYNLKFPPLVAVVNCPQFMANGQVVGELGYDPRTGILYDPRGVSFPAVPAYPTSAEVKAALQTLKRLYRTFSFEEEVDRAVAISLPLTLVARTGIETSPLHAFDAPIAGSGKSKLVSIASIIATGHDAGVIAQGHTPEEFEKRMVTQLMKGKQLIAIDNCNSPLDGDLLNQALTQVQLEMRILGQSKDFVARCATVTAATGNNLIIVGDLTRRSLKGRLDPKVERPELQQFEYDPIADARAARGEIVAAALTILRAYHVAGRPGRLPQLQSFAGWSDVVRSAMVWLDIEDPVKTQDKLRANDPVLTALVRVASAWRTAFGNETRTASEAVADAEVRTSAGSYDDQKLILANPIINEALMAVAGRNRAINPEALGRYLGKSTAKIVTLDDRAKVRFEKRGTRQGAIVWVLADAP